VVADPAAVKIRAEDGRSVSGVDISPFISDLPGGASTKTFSSENASGSTSQAANIMEMLEAGAGTLLIDEDTSATNFMIRDHRMQELIAEDKEPITPLVDKIRQLYTDHGVSSVLVMGGSGDYFEHADTVIAMEAFEPHDVTERAKDIARTYRAERESEGGEEFGSLPARRPRAHSLDPTKGKKPVDVKARGTRYIQFGREDIDLASVEQLVDESQTRAIAQALVHMKKQILGRDTTLKEATETVERTLSRDGLDILVPGAPGDLAGFRRFELVAALNRLRSLAVERE
jgi:predicted ABC-class ATPase